MSNKHSVLSPNDSPKSKNSQNYPNKSPKNLVNNQVHSNASTPTSPIKYLLQNHIKMNTGKEGERTAEEV
jgi:hypothetical protein